MKDKAEFEKRSHWSVDFVEHLRTVHFSLTMLSLTLVVLNISSDEHVDKALTQASQIEYAMTHWDDLKHALVNLACEKAHQAPIIHYTIALEAMSEVDARSGSDSEIPSDVRVAVRQPDPTNDPDQMFWGGPPMKVPPFTLSEFMLWWDRVQDVGLPVYLAVWREWPTPSPCRAFATRKNKGSPTPFPCTILSVQDERVPIEKNPPGVSAIAEQTTLTPRDDPNSVYANMNTFVYARVNEMLLHQKVALKDLNIEWQVATTVEDVGEAAIRNLFPHVGKGRFVVVFHDLVSLSPELMNLPLKDLSSRVQMIEEKQQVPEIMGLKIPLRDLGILGSALLLAVQFYFWLHLHELKRKLDPTSPGRDVAWIGLYDSRVAGIAMIVSACVLPLCALAALARPSLWDRGVALHADGRLAAVASLLSGVVLSALTANRIYRLRVMCSGAQIVSAESA